jgi:hypothetical protein
MTEQESVQKIANKEPMRSNMNCDDWQPDPANCSLRGPRCNSWELTLFKQATISNLSNVFTSTLLMSEGLTGETWEPSNKMTLFPPSKIW